MMRYFVITGLDEGTPIVPFIVDYLDTAIMICSISGDAVRYREEFKTRTEALAKLE